MKNKKLLGMLAIILVFGNTFIGCINVTTNGESSAVSDLDGIWMSTAKIDDVYFYKLVASNGIFMEYIAESKESVIWKEVVRGTYPKGAKSSITSTIVEINIFMFGDDDVWKLYEDLGTIYQGYVGPKNQTSIIVANQFIAPNGVTFEKVAGKYLK